MCSKKRKLFQMLSTQFKKNTLCFKNVHVRRFLEYGVFLLNCVIDMWNNLCDFMVHSLTVSTFGCSLSIVILSVYNKERDIGTVFLVVYMLTTCLFFHFVLVCIFIIYTYNLSRDCLCSVYCLSYVM